ncbi:MAG: 50S ribosomal protein L23 [Cyanobacteria bacterium NC_groundwater_1444_Ag_S-0.65um_54_12]|nr:50S ribosomal protein L23 [Cyanobacteria bacterium NC_groundwater_1444_Ag_S-0.65um_54_12]
MNDLYAIIRRPLITEKNTQLGEQGTYCFEVDRTANKIEIKHAVELLFKVKVKSVNTAIVRGHARRVSVKTARRGRAPDTKKAFVTLAAGYQIELYGQS